ncbi:MULTISPECIES: sedoheptulose 7-phosphate cyclase [unclassified Microbacterium]|uniref:sedoheptulose 7-phosphate cyclase n=1 Tax=unclassified Microbacterium TaxID=2609290 RepID=UPI000CFD2C37|nr:MULTISPECIES: sedoheptulose 7-phosphate cyclase [unclassified Microbacterium]PQZ60082.1 2-epi-5-epi-valiolone synthase [Microbacterium sp. MYb43]PQZ79571.1 2-epi-5-epi-valiolone synthase [Microbacterium sp. MYb40]PRB23125.1 2-epi-5-epi-valiolone synthase [Microbacterium sp. MYb54]PRB27597.1 2-epi-5-epi-valiolone synthase [Microbacterium sp. MYb50]PRB65888.1 2-epi-5-epi-valiolone synthase [Microbacterium sp. MYb24]
MVEIFKSEIDGESSPSRARWRVSADHRIEYDVEMVENVLEPDNRALAVRCGGRVLAVVDHTVEELYGSLIRAYFAHHGIPVSVIVVPAEEHTKELSSVVTVADAMADAGLLRRSETVVVFGGGVVMDVVGLAANLFRRGVPYVRVPTTLIGLVDAGVGVKTGVNRGKHKNRLGTYFAPTATLVDPLFLASLPPRHIRNGLAEIVKIALVKDAELLSLLESAADPLRNASYALTAVDTHEEILARAIGGMLSELEPNLHETDLERIVDFGHTFSPSLELIADPPLLHGEAVAVDMALCVELSLRRGLLTEFEARRAFNLLFRLGLPLTNRMFEANLLEQALDDTIKHRDGLQRVPLLTGIGRATFVNDLTSEEVAVAVASTRAMGQALEGSELEMSLGMEQGLARG